MISKFSHPHICTLHDIGSQHGIDYLVMEYVEGETLEHRLVKVLQPAQGLEYAIQIADALEKAHRQVQICPSTSTLTTFSHSVIELPSRAVTFANMCFCPVAQLP